MKSSTSGWLPDIARVVSASSTPNGLIALALFCSTLSLATAGYVFVNNPLALIAWLMTGLTVLIGGTTAGAAVLLLWRAEYQPHECSHRDGSSKPCAASATTRARVLLPPHEVGQAAQKKG